MKTKSKNLVITLLTTALAFSLFVAISQTARAVDDPFQVTENPLGAVYLLNEAAVPLKATFEYDAGAGLGYIDSSTPIKVQWYWSNENSNTSRSNGFGESEVEYARQIKHSTALTPATDTVGVRYYYAVLSYAESGTAGMGNWESVPKEAVSDTARIEVKAPPETDPDKSAQGFRVKKVDEDGKPLAGAVIVLTPQDAKDAQDSSARTYEAASGSDGYASFTAADGSYILSEKQAPSGYNATDDKYNLTVTEKGVFIDLSTHLEPYETVTFVNKKIPALNKDDHFAFMQGYPDSTFRKERNMTRAEAVVMFSRLLTESMNVSIDYRNSYYPDVASAAWHANQVGYMQSLGVLADYSRDGNFRPDDPVTRAEFATLAAHFDNLILVDTNKFSDVPASHWAVKYINSAAAKGWITGYPEGTFKPEAYITRAEVVMLVGRMLDRIADNAYLTANKSSLPRIYSDLATSHWAYLAIMEASTGHDYTRDGAGEHWTAVYQ